MELYGTCTFFCVVCFFKLFVQPTTHQDMIPSLSANNTQSRAGSDGLINSIWPGSCSQVCQSVYVTKTVRNTGWKQGRSFWAGANPY